MTTLDWVALGIVALAAFGGAARGLVSSAFSLAGLVGGALIGSRLAPHLLADGADSPYSPIVTLAGAVAGAILLEGVGSAIGESLRKRLRASFLRGLDTAGGVVLGTATGLALVWVLGAIGLNIPGRNDVRRDVQRSIVLQRLNSIVPPRTFLNLLARFDPLPSIAGPPVPNEPPDPEVLRQPGPRRAAPSIVRILGTACGLGVEGSGWVAGPGLVVTAAHVVAGQTDTTVTALSGGTVAASAVAFDQRNDVAVLRVPGLRAPALRLVDPRQGTAVAILGYPENGPLASVPGRIGSTAAVITEDAYGRGPVLRTVTSLSGAVRHGNSGGPAVDASGAVQTTVFASRTTGKGGFGVPASAVRRALESARGEVSTGPCA